MNNLFNHKIIHINYEFTPQNSAALKGKVALHLPLNAEPDETEIPQIAQRILAHQIKSTNLSQNEFHAFKITTINQNQIVYSANEEENTVEVAEQLDPLVKILSVVEENDLSPIVAISGRDETEGFIALLNDLWDLFVGALYYLMGIYRDKDLQPLMVFSSRFNQSGPESLSNVLGIFKESIRSNPRQSKDHTELLNQLIETEETCRKIQEAANDPAKVATLSRNLAESIVTHYGRTKGKEGRKNLATFDLGYYRGDTYHPQLVTFFRENDAFKMRIVNMDPHLTEIQPQADKALNRINPIQEYEFVSAALEEGRNLEEYAKQLEGFFKVLIPFQTKGEIVEEKEVKKEGVNALRLVRRIMNRQSVGGISLAKGANDSDQEGFKPLDILEVMAEMTNDFGLKRCQGVPELLKKLSVKKAGDWWKQIFVASQALSPTGELGKDEKIKWERAYLQNYIDQLNKYSEGRQQLSFAQKKEHILAIEKTLEKLEKSYESLYGDRGAFGKIWEPAIDGEEGFSGIKTQINEMKLRVLGKRLDDLNQSSIFGSSWNAEMSVTIDRRDVETNKSIDDAQPGILTQQSKTIEALRRAIDQVEKSNGVQPIGNLQNDVKSAFEVLLRQAKHLFNEEKYSDILTLIPVILDLLPPPQSKLWNGLSSESLEFWSEELTRLVHHFWEAHLRLEKMSLDQMEAFAIANVRAIQIKLLRERAKQIRDDSQNEDDQAFKAFDGFTCDTSQILHLLHQHPFHRSGFNAQREEKRLALEHFFTEGEGKGNPIALDTRRGGILRFSNRLKDLDFASKLKRLPISVFESALERDQRTEMDVLPGMLIDFRRLNIFSQCLMHPEATLHRAFNLDGKIGEMERQRWLLGQFAKVVDDDSTDEDASKGLFAEEWREKRETIQQMSSPIKLKPHHTSAEASDEGCIVAYSGLFNKLEYQPCGTMFNDNRQPFHDRPVVGQKGNIPNSYLENGMGIKDDQPRGDSFNDTQRPRDQEIKQGLTEVTTWLLEAYDPSSPKLDQMLNAKLRGLELLKPGFELVSGQIYDNKGNYRGYGDVEKITHQKTVSLNSIYNVFDIIFNRPDILDNESVQRVLELTLYRTGLLQKLIHNNPDYFEKNQIGEKLEAAIQQAIHQDQKMAASFLIQISESLREQLETALSITRNPTHLCNRLLMSEEMAVNENFRQKKEALLQKIVQQFSTVNGDYSLDQKKPDSKKTRLQVLQDWANDSRVPPSTRKHLYITLLDIYMRSTTHPEHDFTKLQLDDWAHLVQAFYFVKYSGEDAGNPVIQRDVERWFVTEALPYMTENIMTDSAMRNDLLTMHWQLSEVGKAELPAKVPNWVPVNPYVFKIENKDIVSSMLTGVISVDGQSQGFETVIPQDIIKRDDYQKLFGNKSVKARVLPATDSGDVLDFHFTLGKKSEQKKFIIRQDLKNDKAAIIQEINYHGKTNSYVYQCVKEGDLAGGAKLLQKYGFWQALSGSQGLCIASDNLVKWEENQLVELSLKTTGNKVSVSGTWTSEGDRIVQDPDKQVLSVFGFADGADVLVVEKRDLLYTKVKEIRFLSKGLSLVKNDHGQWVTQGQYRGYQLIQEDPSVGAKFGKDFHQFLLPVQKENSLTGVKEKKFLIWPAKLQKQETKKNLLENSIAPETDTAAGSENPILSVTVKEGAVFAEEGQMQGSSASFFYLAYASLMQGRYEAALGYLEKAQKSPFNQEESKTFNAIANYISHHDDSTKKGLAFRLRAAIAVENIQRVQMGTRVFRPEEWKQHLDKIKHQMSLYEGYKKKLHEENPERSLQTKVDPTHILSAEERINFERTTAESIEFLVVNLNKNKDLLTENLKTSKDAIKKLKEDDLQNFMKTMIFHLKKNPSNTPIDDLKSPYISKQAFYDLFLGFINQIALENLTPNHWKVQRLKSLIFQGVSEEELRVLECGKQALIALAEKANKVPVSEQMFENIQAFQEAGKTKLGMFSLIWDMIVSGVGKNVIDYLEHAHTLNINSINFSCNVRPAAQFLKDLLKKIGVGREAGLNLSEDGIITGLKGYLGVINFIDSVMPGQNKNNQQENLDYATTIEQINQELKKNDTRFSAEEKLLWDVGIELIKGESESDTGQIDLVKIIVGGLKYKINVLAMRHHAEKIQLINDLEKKADPKRDGEQFSPVVFKADEPSLQTASDWLQTLRDSAFEPINQEEMEVHYQSLGKSICDEFVSAKKSDLAAMENQENELRKNGVLEAVNIRIEEMKKSVGSAKSESLLKMKEEILSLITQGKEESQSLRNEILKTVKAQRRRIPELDNMLKRPWSYSEADIFDKVLELYQFGKLFPKNPPAESVEAFTSLEKNVTKFLISGTQVQQLQIALSDRLERLLSIQKEGKQVELATEWEMTSKALYKLLKGAANTKRYLNPATNELNNPRFTRKYLVAEYRLGVIFREDQNSTTELMINQPTRAILRPPGFGKSKAVIPPLLALMAERGKFPVVLETEELCRIAQQDLDKMNRMIFSQARHIFQFHSSYSTDHSELADEYYRLLDAKKSGGYIVTSIESLAALDNTLIRLGKKLKSNYDKLLEATNGQGIKEIQKDKKFIGPMMELLDIQKQRHWLMKIREVIHSGQFVADEVDDIFDINRWVNEAVDEHEPPNKKLSRGVRHIIETILSASEDEPALHLLKEALIKNQQANFNPAQISSALNSLAEKIYSQETPFGLLKADWDAIKSKVSKEQFVKFVMGGKNAKINLKWDEEVNKFPLEYIGILKHLITSTLPTVFGEEVDLDYGLNEDGCTIEPLKKGEKQPNTRHGNEYELISYHYAYYASRVPSKEFFSAEWQKIQTQITQGTAAKAWEEWYRKANVAEFPPKEQVEMLFKELQKPDSWQQRLLLLSDAGLEKVRIFPKQIKCNVQDPLLDEKLILGGASGTVNFYALPEAFQKDPSVDSRAVSGDIDLSLAEMHQNGLKDEIKTFGGTQEASDKDKILELAQDLECRAIINQGGALEGMNSKKVVQMLRKKLGKVGNHRQILFVDPKTRQQMMWDPNEKSPKIFDASKLRENYLVYFGPPDTRGTDFPIPFGYAGFIIGKTMNEEQRQQAIMRLRQFGRGQTVRVFMHKSIQHSLNAKLERDNDHPVTLGELINEVKRRSLERKAQSNWKSGVHKTQVPIMRTIKEYWFKPWIKDVNEYWKVDTANPDKDFERIFFGIAADIALYDTFGKRFVHKRKPDFKADFEPVEHARATVELENTFDKEEKKAEYLLKDFDDVVSGERIFEILKPLIGDIEGKIPMPSQDELAAAIDQYLEKSDEDEVAKMLVERKLKEPIINGVHDEIEKKLGFLAAPAKFALGLRKKTDKEFVAWLKQSDFRKQIINGMAAQVKPKDILDFVGLSSLIDPETKDRLNAIHHSLKELPKTINGEKKKFIDQEKSTNLHSTNLRTTVPKSQDTDANSQEQVQQQQQQQPPLQQVARKSVKPENLNINHKWHYWLENYPGTIEERSLVNLQKIVDFCTLEGQDLNRINTTTFRDLNGAASELTGAVNEFGFSKNLHISINELNLLKARKILNGDTMDRVAIVNRNNQLHFFLIDQQDQNVGFSPGIQVAKGQDIKDISVEVHAIRSELSNPEFGPTDYLEGHGPSLLDQGLKKEFLEGIVQMKLLVGSIFFNKEETIELTAWLSKLSDSSKTNLAKLLCEIHSVDRVTQIRAWNKSPLEKFLT